MLIRKVPYPMVVAMSILALREGSGDGLQLFRIDIPHSVKLEIHWDWPRGPEVKKFSPSLIGESIFHWLFEPE